MLLTFTVATVTLTTYNGKPVQVLTFEERPYVPVCDFKLEKLYQPGDFVYFESFII